MSRCMLSLLRRIQKKTLFSIEKMSESWSFEEKRNKDNKALTQIHIYLSNNILQDGLREITIVGLWLKLEQLCMTNNMSNNLRRKTTFIV